MDTTEQQRFSSLTNITAEQYAQDVVSALRYRFGFRFMDYADSVRRAVQTAFAAGMHLGNQPNPNDEREIVRLRGMVSVAEDIFAQKDEQIARFKAQRTNFEAEIDRLLATIERNKTRIKALESDPTNEEARFNIERQYEREFTNTSHLMGEISDLTTLTSIQKRKITQLEEQIERLKTQVRQFPIEESAVRTAFQSAAKQWHEENLKAVNQTYTPR